MKTNTNKVPQWAKVTLSGLDALSKGFERLGASIKKSGLMPHLVAFWCIAWGLFGFIVTVYVILNWYNL